MFLICEDGLKLVCSNESVLKMTASKVFVTGQSRIDLKKCLPGFVFPVIVAIVEDLQSYCFIHH